MVLSCRLCLTENPEEELKNVFQCNLKYSEDTLVDILFWVFSVEIDVTDPFTKWICCECIQLIEYILQVKNTFQKNQESLKNCFPIQDYGSLRVQALEDDDIGKVCTNGSISPSYSTTPSSSPRRSRYSKNVHTSSSPRVRVSVSTLEAMCPLNLNLVPLENTQEYLKYRRLKNGSFKKRKYRLFNMDVDLLDDICSTLEDKKYIKTEPLRKEIGVLTENSLQSKGVNTDETSLCTCYKNISLPVRDSTIDIFARDLINKNKVKNDCGNQLKDDEDDFSDIICISKNMISQKDVSTNTENVMSPMKDIGINAKIDTVTTGTLTKRFKQMKKENVVKVNIDSLYGFGPTVVLEPLEDILIEEKYKQIDEFRYIKIEDSYNPSSSDYETSEDLEEKEQIQKSKKQRFLDYYNNFSSFAVRELIAGKKIRDTLSETSEVLKVSNVCRVVVCDFCSKSFFSQISLNVHYQKAHRRKSGDTGVTDVDGDLEFSKKIIKQRGRPPGKSLFRKRETKNEHRGQNGDYTTQASTDNSKNCLKESENGSARIKSADLRKTLKINYNLHHLVRQKTKAKQMQLQLKGKKRRRTNFNRLKKLVPGSAEDKNISYAWDQKSLGKYSAISYCRNYSSGDERTPMSPVPNCDIKHKTDVSLDKTIQKLGDRLDSSRISVRES